MNPFVLLPILLVLQPFVHQVTQWLDENELRWTSDSNDQQGRIVTEEGCQLISCGSTADTVLHLIPTQRRSPILAKNLTDSFPDKTIIHLHQDVWERQSEICQSRLLEKLGASKAGRIFGRKTTVQRLLKEDAHDFLREYHLWGSINSKYYYGLYSQAEELVAVGAFSSRRKVMRKGKEHRSVELVRYCSKGTIVGGISKLVKNFVRTHNPDDVVTIIDRDWGTAEGWYSLGFEPVQDLPPSMWVVDTNTGERTSLVGYLDDTLPFLDDLAKDPSEETLSTYGFVAIYGAGMERLLMLCDSNLSDSAQTLWDNSVPCYPSTYYSTHSGVSTLLERANELSRGMDKV
jgi:hypothetical protein